MPTMKPCLGLFGRLFGHSYQPRYTEAVTYPDNLADMVNNTTDPFKENVLEAVGAQGDRLYHYDICPRCGDTVEPKE